MQCADDEGLQIILPDSVVLVLALEVLMFALCCVICDADDKGLQFILPKSVVLPLALEALMFALCSVNRDVDDEGLQFVLPDSVVLALARAAPASAAQVKDALYMHAPEPSLKGQQLMSKAPYKQVCVFIFAHACVSASGINVLQMFDDRRRIWTRYW